jgi:hypothetical protein
MNEKELLAYNEEQRQKYPIGTVIWCMSGKPRHGNVYWSPLPRSIEQHPEKGGFTFDIAPITHGSTWNNIGRNYFLSREECLADWGDKPRITEDDCPVEEQENPDPAEYGKRVIWRDDSMTAVIISIGLGRMRCPLKSLKWHNDPEAGEYIGNGDYLTLDEIRDQIWEKMGCHDIIEILEESPLQGVIHLTGNYPESNYWYKHGTTRGYA